MAVQIKYASKSTDRAEKNLTASVTYQGYESELKAFASTLKIGGSVAGLDYPIAAIRCRQGEGPFWDCEITGEVQFDDDGNQSNPNSSTGPNSQRLTCSMLSLPVEHHPNYLANWNHYLIGIGTYSSKVPVNIWFKYKHPWIDPTIENGLFFRWIKDLSQMPTTKDTIIDPVTGKSVTGLWGVCHTGDVWCVPTKAADTYDWTVYTITETGKHSSKNQAGWVASEAINSIVTKPSLGDFGLTAKLGGNWKVDNVEVYYDGKHWVASRTYTKSGDAQGWDQELYGEVK